ncbi:MAG: hypothetical protein PHR26_04275, partial [Candidatus ainarchaeum sp.]|nr:hypothetical protein [Candidatus ainarchaeum sp.]
MFPNLKNKHLNDSFFTAKDIIKYLKKNKVYPKFEIPKAVIFCYDRSFFNDLLKKEKLTKTNFYNLYLINNTNNKIGIIGGFGIGAPSVVRLFEELIALGIKKFVSFGTSGTLQKDINVGDLVICNRAIRDEG